MKHNLKSLLNTNDLILIGALFVALALGYNTVSAMQRNYRLQQRYNELRAEVELQQIKNQNLKYTIGYLKTDDYKELAARDKLGKASEGETLVVLPESGKASQAAVAKTAAPVAQQAQSGWRANLSAWMTYLKGQSGI